MNVILFGIGPEGREVRSGLFPGGRGTGKRGTAVGEGFVEVCGGSGRGERGLRLL